MPVRMAPNEWDTVIKVGWRGALKTCQAFVTRKMGDGRVNR